MHTQITQRAKGVEHTYTLVREQSYLNRRGYPTILRTWSGTCCVCGATFSVATPLKPSRYMTRTCTAHRGAAR